MKLLQGNTHQIPILTDQNTITTRHDMLFVK